MRLKSLTVTGFKSFACKTRFDFHNGVTCVVGPNGCGKSNIVDAVKWVLGEQSAKSLRGGEMQDVLFNGTTQRRSASYAEVELTFEDAAGVLARASGADLRQESSGGPRTVTVARRLYRSGESQYLINNSLVRLRDVREMFMDTGVGVDAYSVIEQGKVETFLQASSAERRAVFDEAAGISKYKARKREALRRLERVEQNLLRLSDILGEVQKRLRSIKYQAGKARNYQAYSQRLRELRSLFSLAEYHRLSNDRRGLQGRLDELTDKLAGLGAHIHRLEAARTATETELADLERSARALDGRMAEVSAEISTARQRSEMLTARASELGEAIVAAARRCEHLEARARDNEAALHQHDQLLRDLSAEIQECSRREEQLRRQHDAGAEALRRMRAQLEDEKNGTIDLLRRTAQLHNEINTHSLRRENLHVRRQRLAGRAEEIARCLEELLARRSAVQAKLQEVQSVLSDSRRRLEEAQRQDEQLEKTAQHLSEELSRAQRARSALLSRRGLLKEMQHRLEGVGEGVRRVISAAREGRLPWIRGMLGEFLQADVSAAKVVEAALAGAEQRLVVQRSEDVLAARKLLCELVGPSGGVELICLDRVGDAEPPPLPLEQGGIIARASEWVRCEDPAVAPLVEALLGRTLIVESLAGAFRLAANLAGQWRFVTLEAEVLEPDGRVRLGAGGAGAGVIWRQSELAELDGKLEAAQRRLDDISARTEQLASRRAHTHEVIQALRTAVYEAQTERVEQLSLVERLEEQLADLRREAPLVDEEVRQLAEEIDSAVRREHGIRDQARQLEQLRAQRESEIARLNEAVAAAARKQEALASELTSARVSLAGLRQKGDAAEKTVEQLRRQQETIAQELAEAREQMHQDRQRREQAEQGAAEARSRMETLLRQRDELRREADETAESRRGLEERLEETRGQLARERSSHEELSAQVNDLRVRLSEQEVRIENLVARTAEEVGLDLPSAYGEYAHDEQRDWEAVRAEIADLRGKIERLGNVNLDAIAEQDELQRREQFLTEQIEDVRKSRRQLGNLIQRINAESRRRFEESFRAVRANFNELFRKLFGGGKADILLTDPDDVLESGIDIVARPPGKEPGSISLLSGGEKTLTALALLFSFFRARPSPFCLLDEVDAALDEANTDRFVRLVREFLDTSQFIIISHAKRTIAMADQIYGVTMQEPGVSTRISVRFEEAEEMAEPAAMQSASA